MTYKEGVWGDKAKTRSKDRKEYFREYNKKWIERHRKDIGWVRKRRVYIRSYMKRSRDEALKLLGSKCVNCGFDDWRALQIDHVNGGGSKETKVGSSYWNKVMESYKNKENKYQILCANCNFIKRYTNNEVVRKGGEIL